MSDKVDSGTTPPAAGGAYGREPDRRFGAAREVGSAPKMLVDVSFDQAGEFRVAVVGFLACPWQDFRLKPGVGVADLDQALGTRPQVQRLQGLAEKGWHAARIGFRVTVGGANVGS